MNDLETQPSTPAARISDLIDGECSADEWGAVCRDWNDDVQVRACWHAYSLIGDVLRSSDLAQPAARDEALLRKVRSRLEDEPVPVVPKSATTMETAATIVALSTPGRHAHGRWTFPVAIAAGLALVGGVAWQMQSVQQPEQPSVAAVRLVQPPAGETPEGRVDVAQVSGGIAGTPATQASSLTTVTAPGPQFEPYLRAHRMVPAKAAFGPAPGFILSVANEPAAR